MNWIEIGVGLTSLLYLFLVLAALVRMERTEARAAWERGMREGIDCRTIWFWQTGRFLDAGFCVSQDFPTLDPGTWLEAIATALRPTAIRDVTETNPVEPALDEARP